MSNPDIVNHSNPMGSHSRFNFSSKAVGGKRRRNTRHRKTKLRRKQIRKQSRRNRRKQRGGLNPIYRSYSASFDSGKNGMYANGPSVGHIIEQFN